MLNHDCVTLQAAGFYEHENVAGYCFHSLIYQHHRTSNTHTHTYTHAGQQPTSVPVLADRHTDSRQLEADVS